MEESRCARVASSFTSQLAAASCLFFGAFLPHFLLRLESFSASYLLLQTSSLFTSHSVVFRPEIDSVTLHTACRCYIALACLRIISASLQVASDTRTLTAKSTTSRKAMAGSEVNQVSPPMSLLNLPAEIRLQILRMLLRREDGIPACLDSYVNPLGLYAQILRTCTTMSEERSVVLYQENTFELCVLRNCDADFLDRGYDMYQYDWEDEDVMIPEYCFALAMSKVGRLFINWIGDVTELFYHPGDDNSAYTLQTHVFYLCDQLLHSQTRNRPGALRKLTVDLSSFHSRVDVSSDDDMSESDDSGDEVHMNCFKRKHRSSLYEILQPLRLLPTSIEIELINIPPKALDRAVLA